MRAFRFQISISVLHSGKVGKGLSEELQLKRNIQMLLLEVTCSCE